MKTLLFSKGLNKKISSLVFLLITTFSCLVFGQEYQKLIYKGTKKTLPYRLLLPENYDSSKQYPLILFLHGVGERGNDNELQLTHGSDFFLKNDVRKNFPAIVVFPQCSKNTYWAKVKSRQPYAFFKRKRKNEQLELVEEFINYVEDSFPIRSHQIYLGGLSMGGMGTLELVYRNPKKFAAAFSICGGAHSRWVRKLQHTPLWLFHGKKDQVISHEFSQQLYNGLLEKNAPVRFTSYPEHNHFIWNNALQENDLLEWVFSNSLKSQ
ncbi:MAG: alpha/beta hydrolase-fold protein [Flavobacteriaceae bacterium]